MNFDSKDPISSVFADLLGTPAWLVRKGHGSFLTFEFGKPSLDVREPALSNSESAKVRELMARRRVTVRGEWHLWIYCCHWQVSDRGTPVSTSEDGDDHIIAAAEYLDGQALTSVSVTANEGTSRFIFDLGGVLDTKPYVDPATENWTLFSPDGRVFGYRADGRFSWHPAETKPDDIVWLPLEGGE